MDCLSSAFPEWNTFTSARYFLHILMVVRCWEHHLIVQEPDYQMCFCWKLGACFDKTLFHRDLGTWEESLCTSKSELKRGLSKMSWLWHTCLACSRSRVLCGQIHQPFYTHFSHHSHCVTHTQPPA